MIAKLKTENANSSNSMKARLVLVFVTLICFYTACPADSKTLSGYVDKAAVADMPDGTASGSERFPSADTSPVAASGPGSRPSSSASPYQIARALPPSVGSGPTPPNSFPAQFLGRWQCLTKVTTSAVKSVSVGTKLVSEVTFVRKPDGRVVALWLQPGWTEAQATAVTWSPKEARVDRTCYFYGDGMDGQWASRSRDHFVKSSPYQMECKSYVDQYVDGRYIGRYRTVSLLTRVGTVNTIARSGK